MERIVPHPRQRPSDLGHSIMNCAALALPTPEKAHEICSTTRHVSTVSSPSTYYQWRIESSTSPLRFASMPWCPVFFGYYVPGGNIRAEDVQLRLCPSLGGECCVPVETKKLNESTPTSLSCQVHLPDRPLVTDVTRSQSSLMTTEESGCIVGDNNKNSARNELGIDLAGAYAVPCLHCLHSFFDPARLLRTVYHRPLTVLYFQTAPFSRYELSFPLFIVRALAVVLYPCRLDLSQSVVLRWSRLLSLLG
ncbi:hypothetical protein B0H21DRAFT_754612 [Amylocystis lapponica]|nr:hypothetical protein B0H21DRAFT_754612 [Amylocystis lapponica]